VIEAENVSYGYDQNPIIKDFTSTIMRGDRVGIIGPNGAGKSTLINLLLDRLQPDSGTIKQGTKIEVAFFDQLRSELKLNLTTQENVAGGSDKVIIDGKSKHVISYLQDFLFSPERARAKISKLSGGERNRLLLAKLFAKPSNVLVMDEPTNDLDVETLELLEELVMNYQGTILLVSHDRDFIDNVVSSTLVFENADGRVNEYVGGYKDWLHQRKTVEQKKKNTTKTEKKNTTEKTKKLSYQDQKELDSLPGKIEKLDKEKVTLHAEMAKPEFYSQDEKIINKANNSLAELEDELSQLFSRWEELEALQS
jgi:ATP-binding cassette subfamily F protein uup